MKRTRRVNSPDVSAEAPMDDESMAMVYVGDVYSLVVQEEAAPSSENKTEEKRATDDSLWPLIR